MPVNVQCEERKLVITPREEDSYIDAFEEQMACIVAEKKGRY